MDDAIALFLRARDIAPKSETVSKGLFHCYWENGEHHEAIQEAYRYLAISDSEDYRQILAIKDRNDLESNDR